MSRKPGNDLGQVVVAGRVLSGEMDGAQARRIIWLLAVSVALAALMLWRRGRR